MSMMHRTFLTESLTQAVFLTNLVILALARRIPNSIVTGYSRLEFLVRKKEDQL